MIPHWYGLARRCGIPVHDEHGDLLPDIGDAITRTVAVAVWFGVTAGHLTLADSCHISGKYLYR